MRVGVGAQEGDWGVGVGSVKERARFRKGNLKLSSWADGLVPQRRE